MYDTYPVCTMLGWSLRLCASLANTLPTELYLQPPIALLFRQYRKDIDMN